MTLVHTRNMVPLVLITVFEQTLGLINLLSFSYPNLKIAFPELNEEVMDGD